MVESLLKNASFLVLVLAIGIAIPVQAQTTGDAPADGAADAAGGAALAEPEPEVSDEDDDAEPGSESGSALGQAAATPAPTSAPTVAEDLEEATAETETPAAAARPAASEEASEGGEASTADRLAQAVPTAGVPWSMPISFGNNMTVNTLSEASQPSYDPFFQLTFLGAFRWNFGKGLLIGIQQGANLELTAHEASINSSLTTYPRTLDWQDTRLDATYSLPWSPLGIGITTQLALFMPTSKFSRASGRALGISPLLFLVKAFPVAQGLIFTGLWRYTGWTGDLHAVENPDARQRPCATDQSADGTGQNFVPCNTGANPIRHSNSATLGVTFLPVAGLAFSASYGGFWRRAEHASAFELGPEDGVITNGGTASDGESTSRNQRPFQNLSIGVSYDISSYLTIGLSYNTFSSWYNPNGSVRQPFYNVDSTFNLSLQFRPDFLATELRANRESESAEETARRHRSVLAF
jgi:hypothetical protein